VTVRTVPDGRGNRPADRPAVRDRNASATGVNRVAPVVQTKGRESRPVSLVIVPVVAKRKARAYGPVPGPLAANQTDGAMAAGGAMEEDGAMVHPGESGPPEIAVHDPQGLPDELGPPIEAEPAPGNGGGRDPPSLIQSTRMSRRRALGGSSAPEKSAESPWYLSRLLSRPSSPSSS
jgi:hypothetical protein